MVPSNRFPSNRNVRNLARAPSCVMISPLSAFASRALMNEKREVQIFHANKTARTKNKASPATKSQALERQTNPYFEESYNKQQQQQQKPQSRIRKFRFKGVHLFHVAVRIANHRRSDERRHAAIVRIEVEQHPRAPNGLNATQCRQDISKNRSLLLYYPYRQASVNKNYQPNHCDPSRRRE
jgi:hypothetical protein